MKIFLFKFFMFSFRIHLLLIVSISISSTLGANLVFLEIYVPFENVSVC
jgi:hypothetical protein